MERVSIPEQHVARLDPITDDVLGLRIALVNVFALTSPDGTWALIDAGLPHSAAQIRAWVETQFGPKARPQSIILTHGHFDHVGAAEELANAWDIPVYAHSLELPFLTGQAQYPAPNAASGAGLITLLSTLSPRQPAIISRAVALPEDRSLPGLSRWRWIHTPGHTDGHVSFFRDRDRTLIAGDSFCTTNAHSVDAIANLPPELYGPSAHTSNWTTAKLSVESLAALEPVAIAPGHGRPMLGIDVPERLRQFATDFSKAATPENQRDTRANAARAS
jgi:glyoxylase-like metal-dependent hydrolase (beta-lactamase superfamily II)